MDDELAARAENIGKTCTAAEVKLLIAEHYKGMALRARARALTRALRSASSEVRFAYQRVVRGWDDRALWSLHRHLTKTLGAQLLRLADIAHGFPAEDGWTFERWAAELRQHGKALEAYGASDGMDYDTVYPPAHEALEWVAENLGSLWD